MLNTWVRYQVNNLQGDLFEAAPDMLDALKREQILNQFLRQRWLHTRTDSSRIVGLTARAETLTQDRQIRLRSADQPISKLLDFQEHIVPHFIHISRRMQPEESKLSEVWMLLASRMMIQAAIEILDSPELLKVGRTNARLSIEQCFAWGHVPRNKYGSDSPLRRRLLAEIQGIVPELAENASECKAVINDVLNREDDCVDMFLDSMPIGDGMEIDGVNSPGELPNWTKVRQEALDTVLAIFDAVADEVDEEKLAPIRWLKNQYRLSALLKDVANFLEISWRKYRSSEWHGKPILVQIEQGGIQGMSDEDFRLFKRRAGIA